MYSPVVTSSFVSFSDYHLAFSLVIVDPFSPILLPSLIDVSISTKSLSPTISPFAIVGDCLCSVYVLFYFLYHLSTSLKLLSPPKMRLCLPLLSLLTTVSLALFSSLL
ncbi:unnamed protein product [Citrullus colocynthis]|uniref:Uncharacterized protein n=1 Tax=Citrullus colocynthis TaxID=252529 RepID=A0ABP0ZA62_9ROSI